MSIALPTKTDLVSTLRAVAGGSTVTRITRIGGTVALPYALSRGLVARQPGRLELTEAGADSLVAAILESRRAS